MAETSFKATEGTARSTRQALLTLVREACDTLLVAHPSVVGSLTVSQSFDDGASARLAARMATRVAEEYGLDVDTRVNSVMVIVRLSRAGGDIHSGRDGGHVHLKRNGSRNGGRWTGARRDP